MSIPNMSDAVIESPPLLYRERLSKAIHDSSLMSNLPVSHSFKIYEDNYLQCMKGISSQLKETDFLSGSHGMESILILSRRVISCRCSKIGSWQDKQGFKQCTDICKDPIDSNDTIILI